MSTKEGCWKVLRCSCLHVCLQPTAQTLIAPSHASTLHGVSQSPRLASCAQPVRLATGACDKRCNLAIMNSTLLPQAPTSPAVRKTDKARKPALHVPPQTNHRTTMRLAGFAPTHPSQLWRSQRQCDGLGIATACALRVCDQCAITSHVSMHVCWCAPNEKSATTTTMPF